MDQFYGTVFAIERSEDLASIQQRVRAIALLFGYDRFVLFSASPVRDDLVEKIYWAEGD
ncbi:hypothetical protein [Labrys sp. ZIDIC5]|uniref:hypothetical protein n=1 Tax=Labrys sedimenti TaxID=3106036 RepID=UPI002ACA45F3|nr:hypothetical protein [Labrys sp. ZIDIC5]MDZ5452947.1 hypothetical protein [Labrys sp. ZIDIC5]